MGGFDFAIALVRDVSLAEVVDAIKTSIPDLIRSERGGPTSTSFELFDDTWLMVWTSEARETRMEIDGVSFAFSSGPIHIVGSLPTGDALQPDQRLLADLAAVLRWRLGGEGYFEVVGSVQFAWRRNETWFQTTEVSDIGDRLRQASPDPGQESIAEARCVL